MIQNRQSILEAETHLKWTEAMWKKLLSHKTNENVKWFGNTLMLLVINSLFVSIKLADLERHLQW